MTDHTLSPRKIRTAADLLRDASATSQFAADVIATNRRLTASVLASSSAVELVRKQTEAGQVVARIVEKHHLGTVDRVAKFATAMSAHHMRDHKKSLPLDSLKTFRPPASVLAASRGSLGIIEEINRQKAPILKQLSQVRAVAKIIDSNLALTRAHRNLVGQILRDMPDLPVVGLAADAPTDAPATRGTHQLTPGQYAAAFFVLFSYVREVFKTSGEHDLVMAHVLTSTLLATLWIALEIAP